MDSSLKDLHVSCLQKHRQFLQEELDPMLFSDRLFEERALDLLEHDKVTEENKLIKQVSHLLDILTENKNECFHFLLYILQNEKCKGIIDEIVSPGNLTVQTGIF